MKNRKKRKGFTKMPGDAGARCPYCGSPLVYRSADGIYHDNKNRTMLYVCSRYPECDAYVRTHPGTRRPVGQLANAELRTLRRQAHQYFDKLYLTGIMSKDEAYAWLASIIQAPMSQAHIGYLSDYYCEVVIRESRRVLANNGKYVPNTSAPRPRLLTMGGEPA